MFDFFKKKELSVELKPAKVPYYDVQSLVKDHCRKIIAIGISLDSKAQDPTAFGYDPSGKESLGYALLGVPYESQMFGKSGNRPYHLGTDICIEAIVLCMKNNYPYAKVSEEHLLKLGYKCALSFIK